MSDERGWFAHGLGDHPKDEGLPEPLREAQKDISITCDYGAGVPVWSGLGHLSHSVEELSAYLGVSVPVLEELRAEQEKWENAADDDRDWTDAEIEQHRELAARFAAQLKPPFRLVEAMF